MTTIVNIFSDNNTLFNDSLLKKKICDHFDLQSKYTLNHTIVFFSYNVPINRAYSNIKFLQFLDNTGY